MQHRSLAICSSHDTIIKAITTASTTTTADSITNATHVPSDNLPATAVATGFT